MTFLPRLFLQTLSPVVHEFPLEESSARYLRKVLRLKEGDPFRGFDSQGREYELILGPTDSRPATARVVSSRESREGESQGTLTLAQGLPKGSKMDLILRQGTEAGVDRFIPLLTQHGVSRPDSGGQAHKMDRWGKILVEACRQSGRNRVPALDPLTEWKSILGKFPEFDLVLMPYEKEAIGLRSALETKPQSRHLLVLIGPEGGWSREEVAQAQDQGALPVHLPTPILRTETAGIAAVSMVRFYWESFPPGEKGGDQ